MNRNLNDIIDIIGNSTERGHVFQRHFSKPDDTLITVAHVTSQNLEQLKHIKEYF